MLREPPYPVARQQEVVTGRMAPSKPVRAATGYGFK